MAAQLVRTLGPRRLRGILPRIMLAVAALLCLLPLSSTLADDVAPPVLVSPLPGAVTTAITHPPLGNPLFEWQGIELATKYEIEISRSAGFGVIEQRATTASAKYVPTTSLADGTYYWHVRAYVGISRTDYSPPQIFVKDWSAGGQVRPILQSPADGYIHTRSGYPAFAWEPMPGAATYLFEISATPQFTGDPVFDEVVIKETHTPATTALGNGVYYWRVVPVDFRGNSGTPSLVRQFTLAWNHSPAPIEPADDALLAFTPEFRWQAVPGAREYVLEISSESDFSTLVAAEITKNSSFTPTDPLSNDQEYYWRVYAVDAAGNNGAYSQARRLTISMLPPQLLTPVNNQTSVSGPIFSWTPVAGAEAYQIQCDDSNSFAEPLRIDNQTVYATSYAFGGWGKMPFPITLYWRVRAVDSADQVTDWSETRSFTFGVETAPEPIYPPYYYIPNSELMPVHSDPTIANPLFVWDNALGFSWDGEVPLQNAAYYLLQVDDRSTFSSPNFSITTASLGAAPTTDHPFNDLQDGRLYWWRVLAYQEDGTQIGVADVRWPVRIDTALPEIPATSEITIMYPADGHQVVEHAPILGWQPVTGASEYQVQIARDRDFTDLVDEAIPTFINYVPLQGSTGRLPVGRYYWRVRTATPLGDWADSEIRAFTVNHRLLTGNPLYDYQLPRSITDHAVNHVISDPLEGKGDGELTGLYAALERSLLSQDWIFALDIPATISSTFDLMILFDADQADGSGADWNPLEWQLDLPPDSLPDFCLTISCGPGPTFDNALFWEWSGNQLFGWGAPVSLESMLGSIEHVAISDVLQIRIPFTALTPQGWEDEVGSIGLVAATAATGSTTVIDAVPSDDGGVPNRMAYVSDILNPIYPFDTPLHNPMVHYDLPLMRWVLPSYDSVDGYQVEVARDVEFTDVVDDYEEWESDKGSLYTPIGNAFMPTRAYPDNETYYWRVRVRHERYSTQTSYFDYGPWSRPFRFKLDSRIPTNASASPTDATPTFSWDRVEGVGAYRLQVAQDINFSDPLIDEDIGNTSYTPPEKASRGSMPDGTYFWRVAIKRDKNIYGRWTATMSFTKTSLAPEPLAPIDGVVVNKLPTFSWREVLAPTESPYLSTPQYKLVVADNPNFDDAMSFVTSSASLTPDKGDKFADGTWYWKVATYDRNKVEGTYSPVQTFYKEYLEPELISPVSGQPIVGTPVFRWLPIAGAAYYEVEIDDNPSFTNVRTPVKTDNTSYVPTQDLGDAFAFYWRVRMVDADRIAGPLYTGVVEGYASRMYVPILMRSP